MKNFALTGLAGYIAPRHLKAIGEIGGRLLAAVDPHDSVGIIDKHFPDASYFTEFERFDRHMELLRRGPEENHIDYVSICSPNHLHDAHIRAALRVNANAICEKPLVINPWNLDALQEIESEGSANVYTILQLRVHPSLVELKKNLMSSSNGKKHQILLTYITSRGMWYKYSWKGVEEKSGGVATNIGIHFFDMLMWLFGKAESSSVHISNGDKIGGLLELENADVRWFLSIDKNDLPREAVERNDPTFRSITVDGEEIQFSNGFTDLHTKVYQETLAGRGFGINDARPSIELVHKIRKAPLSPKLDYAHPFIQKILKVDMREYNLMN